MINKILQIKLIKDIIIIDQTASEFSLGFVDYMKINEQKIIQDFFAHEKKKKVLLFSSRMLRPERLNIPYLDPMNNVC